MEMSGINYLTEKAILSELAYANWEKIDNEWKIQGSSSDDERYKDFWNQLKSKYSISDHHPNDETGYSGTLFENINTGDKTLAHRGTDDFSDFDDDLSLYLEGYPANQVSAMEEYVNSLKNQGKIGEGEEITTTGHSLGGALAQVCAAIFSDNLEDAITYNSPGVDTESLQYLAGENFSELAEKMLHVLGAHPPTFAADMGDYLGTEVLVPGSEHSIAGLVDNLQAIMDFGDKYGIDFDSIEKLNNFVEAFNEYYESFYGEPPGDQSDYLGYFLGNPYFAEPLAAAFNDADGSSFFRGSPIILDLDQSGAIERVDVDDSQAFFDLDNDGFREHAEWVSGEDGFLARDINGNGVIDDNSEMFGDNDPEHANGWDKLREHDTNSDGIIDANDAVFEELLIWKDLDGDGFTDEGELMTLTEAGIESINLPDQGEVVSSFEFIGGGTGYAEDVFLELNQMHTVYNGDVDLGMDIYLLPWARGYGEVKHLVILGRKCLTRYLFLFIGGIISIQLTDFVP